MKNLAFVEGCEASIIKENASFCAIYFEEEVQTRFTREPHNDESKMDHMGRPFIFRHLK